MYSAPVLSISMVKPAVLLPAALDTADRKPAPPFSAPIYGGCVPPLLPS